MSDMATWEHSVIIPVAVAIATVIITSLTIGPRLAARSKRIQAYNDARDQFTNSILDLLALCSNLQMVTISDTTEEPRRSSLQAERDRWVVQIGEITTWLIDHWQRYALGYVQIAGFGFRDDIRRYVITVWGGWISARRLDDRIRMLKDFTEPMGAIFLSRWWQVPAIRREARRLQSMLDDLENSAAAEQPEEASQDPAAALRTPDRRLREPRIPRSEATRLEIPITSSPMGRRGVIGAVVILAATVALIIIHLGRV